MSLTKRMVIITVIVLAVCAATFLVVAQLIVISGFRRLEDAETKHHMQLILRALDNALAQMEQVETNYSVWNDTYDFVNNTQSAAWNLAYLQSNYPASTFQSNNLNFIILLDRQGRVVYQNAFNLHDNRFAPVPKDLIPDIKQNAPQLLNYHNGHQYKVGLLAIAEGPLLLSAAPIVKSDYSTPIAGTMIVGRFLDATVLSSLSYNIELPINMFSGQNIEVPNTGNLIPSGSTPYRQWLVRAGNARTTDNALLYGVDGKPAFQLQIHSDPTIYFEGQKTIRTFALFTIFVFLVLSALGLWLLDTNVFRRLRDFQSQLRAIRLNQDLSARTAARGHDEISQIAEEFNSVMKSLEESRKTIIRQAHYDSLTGLPNRNLFVEFLRSSLQKAHAEGGEVAVLFIDFDKFKTINDTYGHDAGDILLKHVTRRLQQCLGEQDVLARFAGDEFTILLPSVSGEEAVESIAQALIKALSEPIDCKENQILVQASIGGAMFPRDGETPERILHHADMAMYYAKRCPYSHFLFISEQIKLETERRWQLEIDMKTALAKQEMFLVYQPKVDLRTRQMIGTEALVRWQHPMYGLIYPGEFIEFAETSLAIIDIGAWVLESACRQNMRWIQQGYLPIPVAVNVSAVQLSQNGFVKMVEDALQRTGMPGHLLELEITEGFALNDIDDVSSKLEALKTYGVNISIDDFGKGYSSLHYLTYLPVDFLKLDRSFIINASDSSKDMTVIKTIIELAHRLKISVLAEGVETQEQLDFLTDNDCDYAQGYFFSRPVDAENINNEIFRQPLSQAPATFRL